MDFRLSPDQAAAREMAIDFARKEVTPYWRRCEAEGVFHRDLIEKMDAAGMFGCLFPEEFGGNGMGFVAQVLVMEEKMRGSIETGMPFNNQGVNVPMAIYRHGTPAQKRRYVPELEVSDVLPGPSGVRAQALARDGSLVDDFRVSRRGRVVSLRNAPSPAATSSLAIAEHLVDLVLDRQTTT